MTLVDTAEIGKKGGEARAAAMSPTERKASAVAAINARWSAYYKKYPDKLKAKLEREKKKAAKLVVKKKAGKKKAGK